MSVVEQTPMSMSRTSITLVVVVLLIAAALAYSQGWFNWSSSSVEMESSTVGTSQTIDQDKVNGDAVPIAQSTTNPAATPAE